MRKAQGLSMNVIIIAAISLLVLVIISVLVLRAGGNLNKNTGCTGVSGTCMPNVPTGCPAGYTKDVAHGCSAANQICCIPMAG